MITGPWSGRPLILTKYHLPNTSTLNNVSDDSKNITCCLRLKKLGLMLLRKHDFSSKDSP